MIEKKQALKQLQDEINDFTIYTLLVNNETDPKNKKILQKIANEEKRHYEFCKKITGEERSANLFAVFFYVILVKIFGTSFALKFMESRELGAEEFYKKAIDEYPEAEEIYIEETKHETELINMLKDKKLIHAGAIVLGMNDALVELTGTLSGIAFAFDKALTVGLTGLIMGIAASLSMAGSAYLESKENPDEDIEPLTYSLYTGIAYVLTTILLIAPFFVFSDMLVAVSMMFLGALSAIILYNFYISVAKTLPLLPRVLQMCAITFGVAIISFGIGFLVKYYFGLDI